MNKTSVSSNLHVPFGSSWSWSFPNSRNIWFPDQEAQPPWPFAATSLGKIPRWWWLGEAEEEEVHPTQFWWSPIQLSPTGPVPLFPHWTHKG
jgi:hypothetical protein